MKKDRRLAELRDAAEDAYLKVRIRVIDQIEPPGRIDLTVLDDRQREALLELEHAETELALYRSKMYV